MDFYNSVHQYRNKINHLAEEEFDDLLQYTLSLPLGPNLPNVFAKMGKNILEMLLSIKHQPQLVAKRTITAQNTTPINKLAIYQTGN